MFPVYFSIAILSTVVILLITDRIKPAYTFMGAAVVLVLFDCVNPDVLIQSFSNASVISIFLLIYLTSVLQKHFDIQQFFEKGFGSNTSLSAFLLRLTGFTAVLSSVMNNTPIVAMLIPSVYQYAKKRKWAPSKLLIPLSYAAIFGGMITLIGTSTNLVLNGFITQQGGTPLAFFDFLIPGLAVSVAGIIFFMLAGSYLLPNHGIAAGADAAQLREYLGETLVLQNSEIAGKSIAEAGLRNLDGVYLAEIYRSDRFISHIGPDDVILEGDRLYFAGDLSTLIHLVNRFKGLEWAKSEKFNLGKGLQVVEAVIPSNSSLEGTTLKESGFRDRYDAAVVGIHRRGERINGKLGEIILMAGDMLLLTAGDRFRQSLQKDKDLYALTYLPKSDQVSSKKKQLFIGSFLVLVLLTVIGFLEFFMLLVLLLGISVALGMFNSKDLKQQTNLDLLILLGGAITLGKALVDTGASEFLVKPLIEMLIPYGEIIIIIGLFSITVLVTTFVTNVAAVSILFPFAWQLIQDLSISSTPVFLALAFGASASFLTPVSYQTNVMVMSAGSYKSSDFLKVGIPFTIVYSIVALSVIISVFL